MIYHGDMLIVLPTLDADSIDACVCDPPYELGFMSKAWDQKGIAFDPATWAEVYRVLKPGAHLVAFGGTRTFHRLTCAIEDAGFEIRDCLSWLYGQGFPKSLDVSKAIDKLAGVERDRYARPAFGESFSDDQGTTYGSAISNTPITDEAKRWAGWGTGLKPGWEPIILARKPLDFTVAENVVTYGTGALNIDACRLEGIPPSVPQPEMGANTDGRTFGHKTGEGRSGDMSQNTLGRWPANVVLSHTPECVQVGTKQVKGGNDPRRADGSIHHGGQVYGGGLNDTVESSSNKQGYSDSEGKETVEKWQCAPDCPVRTLDEQSGEFSSKLRINTSAERREDRENYRMGPGSVGSIRAFEDSGGASRFFYTAKPSRSERDEGCYDLEVSTGGEATDRQEDTAGLNSPRAGAGRRGGAQNTHPTVKPTDLMIWLVKLITPPNGVVLDPFLGSGTTGIACRWEERPFIGIEKEAKYVEIARRRITEANQLFAGEEPVVQL